MSKILTFVTFWFTFTFLASAQSGWVRSGGGPGQDDGEAIAVDQNGNVLVTGAFQGSATVGGIPIVSQGGLDMFTAKYSPDGQVLWVRTGGGSGGDEGRCVAVDTSGNIFITGFFSSAAVFSGNPLLSEGGYDMFVIKYGPSGNLIWIKSGGGPSNDDGQGIGVDLDGNCHVAGGFRDDALFDSEVLQSLGGLDGFIAKYSTAGNLTWIKRTAGCDDDRGLRLHVDNAGNLRISGYFYSRTMIGSDVLSSYGSRDAYFVDMDANGNFLNWTRIGGSGEDSGDDSWVDESGNIYYSGHFSGTVQFGQSISLTSLGAGDFFLAKYNPSGSPLWARKGGGSGDEYGMAVAGNANGEVFQAGPFLSIAVFSDTFLVSMGDYDVVVTKYDVQGNFIWARQMGGTGRDYTYNLCADNDGNVYVTGHFSGTATFDDTTIVGHGDRDFFVVKIEGGGNITGIPDLSETIHSFSLSQNYPNPFNPQTEIKYTLPDRSRATVKIYNTLGQLVKTLLDREHMAGPHRAVWDGTNDAGQKASSGVYIVRLETDTYAASRKMTLIK